MTTCNDKPRRLGELLEEIQSNGYQGLTDEEMDIVIDYRIECAVSSAEVQARIDIKREESKAALEEVKRQREHAQSVLESLVQNPPMFTEVV